MYEKLRAIQLLPNFLSLSPVTVPEVFGKFTLSSFLLVSKVANAGPFSSPAEPLSSSL